MWDWMKWTSGVQGDSRSWLEELLDGVERVGAAELKQHHTQLHGDRSMYIIQQYGDATSSDFPGAVAGGGLRGV